MGEELKKCFSCGMNGEIYYYSSNQKWIHCLNPDCPAMLPYENWQSRPLEDALRAERDELAEKLDMAWEMLNYVSQRWHGRGLHPGILNQIDDVLAEIKRIGKESGINLTIGKEDGKVGGKE